MIRRVSVFLLLISLLASLAAGCAGQTDQGATPAPSDPPAGTAPTSPTSGDTPPAADGGTAGCTPANTAVWTGQVDYQQGIDGPAPGPAGTPAQPGIESAQIHLTESFPGGGQWLGSKHLTGPGAAVVGTDQFVLAIKLHPAPPEAWHRTHLQVEGGTLQPTGPRPELIAAGLVEIPFDKGPAGERIRVTLAGVTLWDGSAGDLTLELCRQQEPRASVSQWVDGSWNPVSADEVIQAAGPLTLRVEFTSPMDRAATEQALGQAADWRFPGAETPALSWENDRTVLLTYQRPAPVIQLQTGGARDRNGLFTVGNLPVVHTGAQPYVAAVSPAGGAETVITGLMPEISSGTVSPRGSHLVVAANRWFTGPTGPVRVNWLVDLASGRRTELPPVSDQPYLQYFWLPSGEPVAAQSGDGPAWARFSLDGTKLDTGKLPPYHRIAPAPDGSRFALVTPSPDAPPESKNHLYPMDLVIVNTRGQVLQTVSRAIHVYRPPTEWIARVQPAWSPDSSQVALLSDQDGAGSSLVIIDAATGRARTVAAHVRGARHGTVYPLAWSPDGQRLAAGGLILDAAAGQVQQQLVENLLEVSFVSWSPDGQWLLYQLEPWSEVHAHSVATGQTTALGRGLPVGWGQDGQALVVRWEGAPYRWRPEI